MRTRLEEFTVNEFVDLMCGDLSLIGTADNVELVRLVRAIAMEYREIADPAGSKSYMVENEELYKARIEVLFFTFCQNLVTLKRISAARILLEDYGLNVSRYDDERIVAEVDSRLNRAEGKLRRMLHDIKDDERGYDVRRDFDMQTAALMAYFKFQIDTATMKATVYAHLVERHNSEIKKRLAAMNKK